MKKAVINGQYKITIKDIADQLCISPATVSLVLNNKWKSFGIKEDTAKKITKYAHESGYVVNSQARALRLKQNNVIGMIVPTYRNRVFASMVEILEEEAKKEGWHAITMNTNYNEADELHALQYFLSFNIQKIVLAGVSSPEPLNALCSKLGVQVVNVDTPYMGAPSVISDNAYGSEALTSSLLAKVDPSQYGQTPRDYIYFIGGDKSSYTTIKRIEGFKAAHKKLGLKFDNRQILLCSYRAQDSYKVFKRLIKNIQQVPLGIFSNSLHSLEGLALLLKENPQIATGILSCHVGCFDWHPFANFLPFNMDVIRQPVEDIMGETISILLKDKKLQKNLLIKIKPQLIKTGGIHD
ncbi:MAG: LacI family DNA-binding transcriptional regulator [Alphaproteobacteria bacterium]